MASAVATEKIRSNWLIKNHDHDPGTNAVKVISADGGTTEKWFDMQDYDMIGFLVIATAGTAFSCGLLEIVASEAENEADATVMQVKTSGTIAINSLAKGAFQECTAEEVAAACTATYPNLRYVTARLTFDGHANDNEGQVVVFAHANKPHNEVTPVSW